MQGSGCRVQGSGFRVQGAGFRVQNAGFRVWVGTSSTRRAARRFSRLLIFCPSCKNATLRVSIDNRWMSTFRVSIDNRWTSICTGQHALGGVGVQFHMQELEIHELGFNQNYCTFALIVLKIIVCSKFLGTKFMNYQSYKIKSIPSHS